MLLVNLPIPPTYHRSSHQTKVVVFFSFIVWVVQRHPQMQPAILPGIAWSAAGFFLLRSVFIWGQKTKDESNKRHQSLTKACAWGDPFCITSLTNNPVVYSLYRVTISFTCKTSVCWPLINYIDLLHVFTFDSFAAETRNIDNRGKENS